MCIGPGDNCAEILPTATYYVATLDYLVGEDGGVPNDGFVGFHFQGEGEEKPEVFQTYIPLIDVVHEWLVNYEVGLAKEYPNDEEKLKNYPSVESRLVYNGCEDLASICGMQ